MEKVKEIIAEFSPLSLEEINNSDSLSDIGIDSLSIVEIVIKLEDTFEIEFDDSKLNFNRLTTVQEIIKFINDYN